MHDAGRDFSLASEPRAKVLRKPVVLRKFSCCLPTITMLTPQSGQELAVLSTHPMPDGALSAGNSGP